MEDDISFDIDDDLDSEESSKDIKNQNHKNDSSFSTENIVNYGKEYENLSKIYSKKEILTFDKIFQLKKINKLNGELDSGKKEKINWKYVYNNVFKKILLPLNLNKIDINKTISIYEISQRLKYCVHTISSKKDKNNINEKKNLIPKIIDIFSCDKKKAKNYSINKNDNTNSFKNLILDNQIINIKNTKKPKRNSVLISLSHKNINITNINSNKNLINNKDILNDFNNENGIRKSKIHVTINLGTKSHEKFLTKKLLHNKENKSNDIFSSQKKNNIIIENLEKKNDAYENIIRSIPRLSDDILFESKQKKSNISSKREAFMEIMNDFNSKNLNIEIKDKTFCDNFYFFPLKQNYDKDNDLEKRGEKILSYKKMTDNLIDLLNI